ncbi:unnamed protein product [Oncorhynchus mykiss]|uniref:protein-tyrosine-phosphatase n=1 Tax=Oncorhynchus mykiss TaxID=8022 RepID=A0A060X6F5_ONCMY|nr:unnamed protein product [Oncorhynchus mykiss]
MDGWMNEAVNLLTTMCHTGGLREQAGEALLVLHMARPPDSRLYWTSAQTGGGRGGTQAVPPRPRNHHRPLQNKLSGGSGWSQTCWIGRTGCFIASSIGCLQLKHTSKADVLGIVCKLRLDRGGMIQTSEQYQFLYLTLAQYSRQLVNTDCGSESPVPVPVQTGSTTGETR